MPELHRLGTEGTVADLEAIVAAFRRQGIIAGLVLPWDRAAGADDLDLAVVATSAGSLWISDAECTWRVEAGRGVATILSDVPLDLGGPELETLACETYDDPPVAWMRRPFSRGTDVDAMHPRTYLIDGEPAHRRLVAREL